MLSDDVRHSIRRFVRRPLLPLLSVVALALAIGAGSVIFSAVYAVLLQPLPFERPDRLVSLWATDLRHGHAQVELAYQELEMWQKNSKLLRSAALISSVNLDYSVTGSGEPMQVEGTLVSSGFFDTLGVKPVAGRLFTPADDVPNAAAVAVMSARLWKQRFGSNPAVLGSSLRVDGQICTIVGIMPETFDYPRGVELWTPLFVAGQDLGSFRTLRIFQGIGRLAEGATREQAFNELGAMESRLDGEPLGISVDGLHESLTGSARTALPILLLAVLGVVVIACVNVTHLRLADTMLRQRELAVRTALGASTSRIARQLLVESLLLSVAGGLLGTLLALYGVDVLIAFAPKDIPRIESASVNGWVLLFTVVLVAASAIATAILPAWQTRSLSEQSLLQETGSRGGTEGGHRRRLRGALMAGEVAVGTALLIGGGLLVDSARRLSQVQPGFGAPERVLTFRVTLPRPKYQPQDRRKLFYESLLAKLRALPGVTDAAAILLRPLSGTVGWDFPFSVEGQTEQQAAANPPSNFESISTNYFRTMAIPVLAGRDFVESDRTGAPSVAIINESFAKRYFPDGRVLGRRIKIGRPGAKQPWMEVVGVVRDVRYREWEAVRMDLYVPVMQSAQHRSDFVVRVRQGDVLRLTPEIRRAVLEVDSDQPVSSVTTVEGLVDGTLARPRFHAGLLTLFAICALLLVVAGVFGVLSQSVAERRQEIGIRLALGALPEQILRMVLREGLVLIGGGIVVGAVLALSMGRVLAHLLYGATWWDPAVYSVSIAVVLVTGLIACWWPAMRAGRSDPVAAMAGLASAPALPGRDLKARADSSLPPGAGVSNGSGTGFTRLSSQGQRVSPPEPERPSTAGPRREA